MTKLNQITKARNSIVATEGLIEENNENLQPN